MSTATIQRPTDQQPGAEPGPVSAPVVALPRRTIDAVLISIGTVAAIVFVVAGALLTWGNDFAEDYVHDELSSQNITFPSEEALLDEGRSDLAEFGGDYVDTGVEAEAYASYIGGHLEETAGGATYADLGGPERAAKAAVTAAVDAGAPQAEIDALQAEADKISGQRNTLFKGETLRGLLLSAYAWSTVGTIAGYAALGAFVAAGLMTVLVVLGLIHHRRAVRHV
jgi:hypothetical protein